MEKKLRLHANIFSHLTLIFVNKTLANMVALTYMHYNVIFLKASGRLYEIDKSASIPWKIIHYFLRLLSNFLVIYCIIGMLIDIKKKGPFEFKATALNYGVACINICSVQRSIYYAICDDKTKKLVLKMNELFKYETQIGLEEKSMATCVALSNKLTFFWMSYGIGCAVLLAFMPFINKSGIDGELPMSVWVPYDWKTSPYFEITYFIELCALIITGSFHASTDVFFTACTLQTTEQFKLLGWELKNLLYTSLINTGVPKEFVYKIRQQFNKCGGKVEKADFVALYDMCESKKFNAFMLRRLNGLIKFHRSLLAFCADMEDFFSPLILADFLLLMATALFTNFIMILTRDASLVLSCLPISSGAYCAILLPCFMADILSSQAEKLQIELYEMPWYMCDKKCKTNIQFMHQNMNKAIGFTVGKFADLNLQLFLWCIRTINSYCIILYQLTE